jgi:hypothetical protein
LAPVSGLSENAFRTVVEIDLVSEDALCAGPRGVHMVLLLPEREDMSLAKEIASLRLPLWPTPCSRPCLHSWLAAHQGGVDHLPAGHIQHDQGDSASSARDSWGVHSYIRNTALSWGTLSSACRCSQGWRRRFVCGTRCRGGPEGCQVKRDCSWVSGPGTCH